MCLAAVAAVTLLSGAALAKASKPTQPPSNLRGFLLRPSEPRTDVFPRTPAFAWAPVRGALCYEFELGTSRNFTENAIVWSNVRNGVKPGGGCKAVPASATAPAAPSGTDPATTGSSTPTTTPTDPAVTSTIQPLRVPAVSVDVALPWFTGQPHALYAHVRAITSAGPTGWSKPFGFNMRWPTVPSPMPAPAGLIRWTPVPGATSYQVWYPDLSKLFTTHTNVADEREYYTFQPSGRWSTVHWRIRAVRQVFGDIPNGLPATTFGPWSPVYTSTNPASLSIGPLALDQAVSDRLSPAKKPAAVNLMPGFTFSGDRGVSGVTDGNHLSRVYISTDRDCVNIVYTGAVTGGPAYAPRSSGPLKLPTADAEFNVPFLPSGDKEGPTVGPDGTPVVTNETIAGGASTTTTTGSSTSTKIASGARVDLPDIDFPSTRYWWTSVPVLMHKDAGTITYVDLEVPQDACAAGRVASFGKESSPVSVASKTPYVAGLAPNGRLLSATSKKPTVFSTPLVAWEPTLGASSYEVQWSRTKYPWRAQGSRVTYSTSAVLDLASGRWYYRVRGLNSNQPRRPEMVWSAPVKLTVAKPKFKLVASK